MKWFVRTWSKAFFPAREEILIVSGSCLAYNETTFSPEMFKKISESLIFPAFPHLPGAPATDRGLFPAFRLLPEQKITETL